jgi:hypothetical protein
MRSLVISVLAATLGATAAAAQTPVVRGTAKASAMLIIDERPDHTEEAVLSDLTPSAVFDLRGFSLSIEAAADGSVTLKNSKGSTPTALVSSVVTTDGQRSSNSLTIGEGDTSEGGSTSFVKTAWGWRSAVAYECTHAESGRMSSIQPGQTAYLSDYSVEYLRSGKLVIKQYPFPAEFAWVEVSNDASFVNFSFLRTGAGVDGQQTVNLSCRVQVLCTE